MDVLGVCSNLGVSPDPCDHTWATLDESAQADKFYVHKNEGKVWKCGHNIICSFSSWASICMFINYKIYYIAIIWVSFGWPIESSPRGSGLNPVNFNIVFSAAPQVLYIFILTIWMNVFYGKSHQKIFVAWYAERIVLTSHFKSSFRRYYGNFRYLSFETVENNKWSWIIWLT